MEEQKTTEAVETQRPVFLTVLCIFTFAGAGLGILLLILSLVGMNALGNFAGGLANMAQVGAPDMSDFASINLRVIVHILLLGGLLFGSILMWGLKKAGFWLYTIAKIAIIVLAFVGPGAAIVKLIVGVAFIIMYGVNLKHMA